MDKITFLQSPASLDACRVSLPTLKLPDQPPAQLEPPAVRPHDTYISQGHPETDAATYKRADMLRQLQQSQNSACEADPVAAELNGHFQVGRNGDWVKSGPGVLEMAAGLSPFHRAIDLSLSGLKAGIKVHEFLVDQKR